MASLEQLQDLYKNAKDSDPRINVRLVLDETNHYNEQLPVEVVRAILDPSVADFFILIKGNQLIPRCKGHYLHTSYIRELLLLDALPERKEAN